MSSSSDDPLARGLTDSVLLVLGTALGAVLGLVSLRLLLTHLSEEDYGSYCLFQIAALALGVFIGWPVQGVIRLGADEMEQRGRLGKTYGSVLALMLVSGLGVALAAWQLGPWIDAQVGHPVWRLAVALAALASLAQLSYVLLQPAGRVGWRTLAPALTRAFYAGFLVLVAVGEGGLSFDQVILLCTVTVLPGVLVPLVAVGRRLGRPSLDLTVCRRATVFGAPLLLRYLGLMAVLFVDVVVIQAMTGDKELVGRYEVAYRIAEQVVVFAFVIEFLAAPALATAAARDDPGPLARFYRVLAPQAIWVWSLGAALLVVLAEPILLLLGAKSAPLSATVLRILALAIAIRAASSLESSVFDAHLLSGWPTAFFFVGFTINLVLDVVLLQGGWGITGPAIATVLGFAAQAVLRSTYLGRRFGLPAWRPYLGVLPVPALLAVHWLSGGNLAVGLLAWGAVTVAVVVVGRRAGLFPAETRELLAQVRMPAAVRRALERFYPGEAS